MPNILREGLYGHLLCNHGYGPLAISIRTEEDSFPDFIELFRLTTMEDIHELNYNNSWMGNLNGHAEIDVTPFDLEASQGLSPVFPLKTASAVLFPLQCADYRGG